MPAFWMSFFAALLALAVLAAFAALMMKPLAVVLMNTIMDRFYARMVHDRYTENLFGVLNVMRHVGGGQNFVETMLRASEGKSISRPMGSPLQLSPWDRLLFQPVYVSPRLPTPESEAIETHLTIGPRAARPLDLEIPIVITAMSYGGALSVEAKIALAKGANMAGTATNTGESYLPQEREAADRLVIQHNRGLWPKSSQNMPQILEKADAIEIHLGQGAQAAAAMKTYPQDVNVKMGDIFGLKPGETEMVGTRFRGVDSPEAFVRMVKELKDQHQVPVGVKLGVSDYIEQDLDVFLEADVDFVTVDGAEGGTHGGPPTLQDDLGIPTLIGISRADAHLRRHGRRKDITLLAAGQLTTPGRFLKAMALGADGVCIGTVAIIALLTEQMQKTLPGEPPYNLVMHSASHRFNTALDIDKAASCLANYLKSCMMDITYMVQSIGKKSVADVGRDDLVALDRDVAEMARVRLAWSSRRDVNLVPEPELV